MQLAHDDALGTIDDEGTVLRHEWDLAEVDLLLFDVANALLTRISSFVSQTTKADDHLDVGAANVMPRWRHSSMLYFGLSRL